MSYLVDTDIISAHLRGVGAITNRFLQYSGRLHVSVVTIAELKVWVLRKQTALRYRQSLDADDVEELIDVVDGELNDGQAHEAPRVRLWVHVLRVALAVTAHDEADAVKKGAGEGQGQKGRPYMTSGSSSRTSRRGGDKDSSSES